MGLGIRNPVEIEYGAQKFPRENATGTDTMTNVSYAYLVPECFWDKKRQLKQLPRLNRGE
jgi:hypothetical protein